MPRLALSVCSCALLFAASAPGAPLLSDNFESYSNGDLNGNGGWTANTGLDVVTGGQDYANGDITIDGGEKHVASSTVSSGLTPMASHSIASQSGEVWMSFTVNVQSSTANDRFWFFLSDNASINSGVTGAIGDTNTGQKAFYSEVRVNTTPTAAGPASQVADQVYFLVGRFSKDGTVGGSNPNAYDQMQLWINPDSTTLGAADLTAQVGSSSLESGVNLFALTVLGNGPTLLWDNLLVGTSQQDVVDVYTTAIPEPASLSLAAVGGVLLLGRRRR